MKQPKNSTGIWFPSSLFAILISAIACTSCGTDDNEDLDLDLGLEPIPYEEVVLDQVHVSTQEVGTVRTDNLDFTVLGNLQDSVFGETRAHFYTQVGLNGIVNIPKNAVLDSLVFAMKYIGGYGNNQSLQDFSIYRLGEALNKDEYTNQSSVQLGELLATKRNVSFPASRNTLSFRVDNLWNSTNIFVGKEYSSSEQFQEAFEGFAVRSTSTNDRDDGYLAYFSPSNAESRFVAYYHYFEKGDDGDLKEVDETLVFDFVNNSNRFSQIVHDYSGQPVENWLNNDSTNSYRGFVQAIGGTEVTIELPQLQDLAASGEIAIQKAELVLPCELGWHPSPLNPLRFLDLKTKNPADIVVDVLDKSNFFWTRTYDVSESAFVYNITSEVQYMITEKRRDPNFVIQPLFLQTIKNDPVAFSVGRYVVKGARSSRPDGAYLALYYSKLDKK